MSLLKDKRLFVPRLPSLETIDKFSGKCRRQETGSNIFLGIHSFSPFEVHVKRSLGTHLEMSEIVISLYFSNFFGGVCLLERCDARTQLRPINEGIQIVKQSTEAPVPLHAHYREQNGSRAKRFSCLGAIQHSQLHLLLPSLIWMGLRADLSSRSYGLLFAK